LHVNLAPMLSVAGVCAPSKQKGRKSGFAWLIQKAKS